MINHFELLVRTNCIVISLGKNPVKGGRPPKDNKLNEIRVVSFKLLLDSICEIELSLKLENQKIKKNLIKLYKIKYKLHSLSETVEESNIQDIWAMEEKVIIFRNEGWTRPPILPMRAERVNDKVRIKLFEIKGVVMDKAIKGIIFCAVSRKKSEGHPKPPTMEISHWWQGAAPNLISKEIIKTSRRELRFNGKILIKIKTEAILCERKYFKELSVERRDLCSINGIKNNILSSIVNHNIKNESEDKAIIIENNKQEMNK